VLPPDDEFNTKETHMDSTQQAAQQDQAALWNGDAGRAWVEAQAVLDGMFEPFERMLADEVRAASARSVLDVGCGTGATTLAIARALGAGGRALGVDVSEPMLALARARAARERVPATFVAADAQSYAFEPAAFDAVVSRFGVMFFEDNVRAFANLRHAAQPGAVARLIAWRGPDENPFMTTAERAAAPFFPNLPPRRPDGPGQFAFADAERVRGFLEQSGWTSIDIRPIDVPCAFPESALDLYVLRLGPLGRILSEVAEPTRKRVVGSVRAAFAPYVHGGEARFEAACWMIAARAG
jgi:ubiquinone/menaquinone biosynthesis C-methylase UbiE